MKRLFRGLRQREPASSYDAVVIGAGIGGLFCANLLARAGLSVLLVEQHYMAGGYCSTFRRGGYTFDAATHFYPLLGNPDTAPGKLVRDLGVETGWIQMDPVDTFHFPDGSRFDVPADFERYRADLDRLFPGHRADLETFFERARDAYYQGLLAYFRGRRTPRFARLEPLRVTDVLDECFPLGVGKDHEATRKLRLLLTGDSPHWGAPPSRTSFVFDSMLRLSYFLGNYYPEGGSQAFADELARVFEERGGHVLMSTRVEEIVVEDGAARGVDLHTLRGPHTGRRIRVRAGAVVSNADLRHTLERLLPARHVPPELLSSLDRLEPTFPCFLTHIGLRGVRREDLVRAQGYYWHDWDPDRMGRNGLVCKIFSPTVYEPAMAPEGGQIVILQKVLEMDQPSVEDWDRHKAQVERFVFGHLCSVLPGIEEHVEVKLSATARTSARFTENLDGAMLGWTMSPDQLGIGRPAIGGPVDDLVFTGHWVRPGGGITPVIVSAQEAAEHVLQGRARIG